MSLNSGLTLGAAVVILFLKPLLTAVFLRAGAVGGMLTPALATGAAMGSVVALAINTWTEHHVSVPAVSLTCAAGVLAITQRAPIWAAIFVWELARPPWWLLAPFLVAAVVAHSLRLLSSAAGLLDSRPGFAACGGESCSSALCEMSVRARVSVLLPESYQ